MFEDKQYQNSRKTEIESNLSFNVTKNLSKRTENPTTNIDLSPQRYPKEIMIVSPEGHHAHAGGLGQMIVGISESFIKKDIACTIVTPLYAEANGNKHRAAKDILNNFKFQNKIITPKFIKDISINFGATLSSATKRIIKPANSVVASIYKVSYKKLSILFIYCPTIFKKLYCEEFSDARIKTSLMLSRGALEIIADKDFALNPEIILSNDWQTALIPTLLKCDKKYKSNAKLQKTRTFHLIHNCGQAYQGRIYSNQFGEDLWPLLNLEDEHYFGTADPHSQDHLNFTAGAILHTSEGIITVSKNYAEQMIYEDASEGLESLLLARPKRLFGISNAINKSKIQRNLLKIIRKNIESTNNQKNELDATRTPQPKSSQVTVEFSKVPDFDTSLEKFSFTKDLPPAKEALKLIIQEKYNLNIGPQFKLMSFVSRLTEQKGIELLTEKLKLNSSTLIESLLQNFPEVQLIIAGPPSNEPTFDLLSAEILKLQNKFPNRIYFGSGFVPHQETLEIILGSDLFLMPSKYEPGGIAQIEAAACGTAIVAHAVGGLKASINDFEKSKNKADRRKIQGFLFEKFNADIFYQTITRAIKCICIPKVQQELISANIQSKNDWSDRVEDYLKVFTYKLNENASSPSSLVF